MSREHREAMAVQEAMSAGVPRIVVIVLTLTCIAATVVGTAVLLGRIP